MKKLLTIFVLALISIAYTNAQNPEFWGVTKEGGDDGTGIIFKTDGSGENQTVVYSFINENYGKYPEYTKLCEASNGKLYGMTMEGGTNDYGVLFEYDPATNTYTKKLDFDGSNTGSKPYGSLIQASNGKLYGMTKEGGANGYGVLFEYDPATGTYTKKIDFDGINKGANPYGSLIQASNGKLYGMTAYGGAHYDGVLFEYDPVTDTYTKKLDFFTWNKGRHPFGSLMQASNGKLYGMTKEGGAYYYGVLFEYDPATDTYTKELDFDGSNKGRYPYGSLIQASNGKLYGLTYRGGANDYGVLFEYDPATDTYIKKLDFDGSNTGSRPYGSLMQASNGKLYGMTYTGGASYKGVLFEYDPATNTYTKKLDFDGSNKGSYPPGSLMQASNGKLYGMTYGGGANNYGVLFEYDITTETYVKKFNFGAANKGYYPYGSLVYASNGKFYGTTKIGGLNNMGVIYEYDPINNTYTKKFDFDGANSGEYPYEHLIQASNGKLYGMTYSGGTNDKGVLFEYDPDAETYTKKLDFDGTDGGNPYGSLMQASNGKLYGMTYKGGADDIGVLFEYDPNTDTYTKKLDFDGTNNGANPLGSFVETSDGKLYGLTKKGGTNDYGVLFEYDPATDTYTKKLDFDGTNYGTYPVGTPVQATNGKLYALTRYGGANDLGVLFEYDPATDTYTKKIDFDSVNGANPYGSLMLSSNGKLYGMTRYGGANDLGVVFEYDPATDTYTKKIDFDGNNGSKPYYSALIETNICYPTYFTIDTTVCDSYTVPSGDETYSVSGTYKDTLPNACGNDSIITINLTVNYSQTTDTSATACDSFTWYGNTYTTSGDYTKNLQTIHGCDSVVTLHLTINYSQTTDTTATACDSYTWHGNTYTTSGDYNDTLQTYLGCDSIVTLHLTVNYSQTTDTTATACDSYTWHGNTYTTSGDYNDTLQTYLGCDSVVTLHLTVNYSQTGDTTATACDQFTWYGNTYTESGDYTETLLTVNGCDSVVTLHLTVNYSQTTDTTATACNSFTWHGNTYTENGDYNDTLQTYLGCDSVVTLHLTINTVDVTVSIDGTTLTANETDANYQWIDCSDNSAIDGETNQSFTPTQNGEYAVIVDNGLCVDTSECVAVTSVGILENNFGQEIKVFPNPTTGLITFEFSDDNIQKLKITDLTGKTLFEKTTIQPKEQIDLSKFESGIYILKIQTDNGIFTTKIVKE